MADVLIGFSVNPEMIWRYESDTESIRRKIPAQFTMLKGGTSLDVAMVIKKFGGSVRLLGALGRSRDSQPLNRWLCDRLREDGISFKPLYVREGTAVADVHVGGHNISLAYKPLIQIVPEDEIRQEVRKARPKYTVVTGLYSDWREMKMAEILWDGGGRRVLNVNIGIARDKNRFEEIVAQVDLLVLNHIEAAMYLGIPPADVNSTTIHPLHDLGPRRLIVTCDKEGALYYEHDVTGSLQLKQPIVHVGDRVDETGAGDCFLGAFITYELEGHSPADCMLFASCAAGLKVLRAGGTNIPSREEVNQLFYKEKGK